MNKRKITLLVVDLLIVFGVGIGMALIFPAISSVHWEGENIFGKLGVLAMFLFVSRYFLKVYSSIWRYANVRSYLTLILADAIACLVFFLVSRVIQELVTGFSFVFFCGVTTNLITLISRFIYQVTYARLNSLRENDTASHNKINIAIVGAGNVGANLAEELIRNPKAHYAPYCFVDADSRKWGNRLHGLKIIPEDEDIIRRIKGMPVQEVVIALPDADTETKSRLYEYYSKTGCKVKIYDYAFGPDSSVSDRRTLREFKIEELLFRDAITLHKQEAKQLYRDKVVLVTGGGGSIGSELCRQIAKCSPKQLIILDIYENNAYEIQQTLIRKYGDQLNLSVVIGSVRDQMRVEEVFATYQPQIVFHAAAHKHVPLMEVSPKEAIKNNVFGTYNVANAAEKYGAEKFILISTDKAVNPTNVMGASKRLCEMVIQCRTESKTEFAAVRFGNVLGSNGSVIPLFRKQIAAGGPITLTDKRIIRYFMTIPEAVSLVMEAGVMAHSGELFVLDMGKPVKILDLAEKMITMSGLTPYTDIDIVEVGLRPGEKLYEELLMKTEELDKTDNHLIFIERDHALPRQEVAAKLERLQSGIDHEGMADIVQAVRDTVPTYHDPEEVNCCAEAADEMKMVKEGEEKEVLQEVTK